MGAVPTSPFQGPGLRHGCVCAVQLIGGHKGDSSSGTVVRQPYLLTQCLVLQCIQIYAQLQLPQRWLHGTR